MAQLIHNYQSAAPESRAFNTHLIELVAQAVHQIAVDLYKQDSSRHKDDALGLWRPPERYQLRYPVTFPPSLFQHKWYDNVSQYPEDIADCVGYWAETRILGGVVLFDRRDPDSVPDATVSAPPPRMEDYLPR